MTWFIAHSVGPKKKKAKSAVGYAGGNPKTTTVNTNTVSTLAKKASIVANGGKNKLPSNSIAKNAAKNSASSGGNSTDARSQRAKQQKRNDAGQFSKSGSSKTSLGKNAAGNAYQYDKKKGPLAEYYKEAAKYAPPPKKQTISKSKTNKAIKSATSNVSFGKNNTSVIDGKKLSAAEVAANAAAKAKTKVKSKYNKAVSDSYAKRLKKNSKPQSTVGYSGGVGGAIGPIIKAQNAQTKKKAKRKETEYWYRKFLKDADKAYKKQNNQKKAKEVLSNRSNAKKKR